MAYSTRRGHARNSWRAAVEALVWLVVAILIGRTWLLGGVIVPLVVASGSMAPTLLGPHIDAGCGGCGADFAIGFEYLPPHGAIGCPNCDRPVAVSDNELLPGDRLLIDRSAVLVRSPKRFEIVALRSPVDGELLVKRVVGLPGETVDLVAGELVINGRPHVKTPSERRRLAVLVHAMRGRYSQEDRGWSPSTDNSHWRRSAGGFRIVGATAEPESTARRGQIDWLTFHDGMRTTGDRNLVRNDLPYNGLLSEKLSQVDDLMLTCRVHCRGAGQLTFVLPSRSGTCGAELDLARQEAQLLLEGHTVARAGLVTLAVGAHEKLEFTTVDGRAELWLDDRLIVAAELPRPSGARANGRTAIDRPRQRQAIGIGARGSLEVHVRDLRLWRDAYFLPRAVSTPEPGWGYPRQLGPQEYFAVGDNAAASEDSRSWPVAATVRRDQILGRAILAWPARGWPRLLD